MRPISLEIQGFTSFREQVTIDFSTLDLFAITGPTGAGKTSIIDAMTYALYGCTPRIGEKQVSELISQGINRMGVLFTFSSGKNEYQIARTGKWTGKQMVTDVLLKQRAGDEWISLADGVQKAKSFIEQIIGLDFNGFTKSVVLPQGRFDEFLKGRVEDRRKMLSDLLDLGIYKRMMQRANALQTEHRAQAGAISDTLQREYADATPERLVQLRESLKETTPQLDPIELQLKRITQFLPNAHALRAARKECSIAEAELKATQPKRGSAENTLKLVQQTIDDLNRKLKGVAVSLERNTYDQAEHVRLSTMLEKAQRLESLLLNYEQIDQLRKNIAADIAKSDLQSKQLDAKAREVADACSKARKDLEKDKKGLATLQEKYGSPDAVQGAIEIQKQLTKEEKARNKLQIELISKDDERKKLDKDLAIAESDAIGAGQQRDRARSDYESLVRSHSAESLKPGLEVGEPCPVCEQTVGRLPKSRRHQPLEKAKQHWDDAEKASVVADKRLASLQALVRPLEREKGSLQNRIADIEQSIREYTDRLHKFGNIVLIELKQEFERTQHMAEASVRRVEELTAKSDAASDSVKDHHHRRALLQKDLDANVHQLEKLQGETDKLRDQLGSLTDVKKLRKEVAKQEEARTEREGFNRDRDKFGEQLSKAKDDLAKAMAALEGLDATIKNIDQRLQVLKSSVGEHLASLKAEFTELKDASGERDEAFQLEQQSSDLRANRDRIQKKVIELEGQIKSLEGKIARAAQMRQDLERHQKQMAIAKTLHNALQGDGFIAFIQEEAYNRLAADGSVHLRTLSQDRYSFTIERDEFFVIDHWNANEARPVTTLSGGESFLASLALALALAEGLSGLSSGHTRFALESLFLDEGFGTLDAETLEYVVSGIEGLSSDNRLIGIISHIPELADRMPARIHVEKSIGGSSITIN